MPKRIDDAPVVALYEQLKNARAVGRQLDIHHQTVNQILRRHRGVCLRCQEPVLPGHKQCEKCEAFDRNRIKERRVIRRRLGLCADCHRPRGPVSRVYCEDHRIAHAEIVVRSDARRQRGAPEGGVPSLTQKLEAIRTNYGDGGVQCFTEAGGRCKVCRIHYTEAAVHLHHIDQNKKNNARSNFECLCWSCHRTAHLLLGSRNLPEMIRWFKRTYPDKPL